MGSMKKYKPKDNNIQKLKLYLKKVVKDGEHDRMGKRSKQSNRMG